MRSGTWPFLPTELTATWQLLHAHSRPPPHDPAVAPLNVPILSASSRTTWLHILALTTFRFHAGCVNCAPPLDQLLAFINWFRGPDPVPLADVETDVSGLCVMGLCDIAAVHPLGLINVRAVHVHRAWLDAFAPALTAADFFPNGYVPTWSTTQPKQARQLWLWFEARARFTPAPLSLAMTCAQLHSRSGKSLAKSDEAVERPLFVSTWLSKLCALSRFLPERVCHPFLLFFLLLLSSSSSFSGDWAAAESALLTSMKFSDTSARVVAWIRTSPDILRNTKASPLQQSSPMRPRTVLDTHNVARSHHVPARAVLLQAIEASPCFSSVSSNYSPDGGSPSRRRSDDSPQGGGSPLSASRSVSASHIVPFARRGDSPPQGGSPLLASRSVSASHIVPFARRGDTPPQGGSPLLASLSVSTSSIVPFAGTVEAPMLVGLARPESHISPQFPSPIPIVASQAESPSLVHVWEVARATLMLCVLAHRRDKTESAAFGRMSIDLCVSLGAWRAVGLCLQCAPTLSSLIWPEQDDTVSPAALLHSLLVSRVPGWMMLSSHRVVLQHVVAHQVRVNSLSGCSRAIAPLCMAMALLLCESEMRLPDEPPTPETIVAWLQVRIPPLYTDDLTLLLTWCAFCLQQEQQLLRARLCYDACVPLSSTQPLLAALIQHNRALLRIDHGIDVVLTDLLVSAHQLDACASESLLFSLCQQLGAWTRQSPASIVAPVNVSDIVCLSDSDPFAACKCAITAFNDRLLHQRKWNALGADDILLLASLFRAYALLLRAGGWHKEDASKFARLVGHLSTCEKSLSSGNIDAPALVQELHGLLSLAADWVRVLSPWPTVGASAATIWTTACEYGWLDVIRSWGPQWIPHLSEDNRSGLFLAAARGQLAAIRVLLACGADPAKPDAHGTTVLMAAVIGGHTEAAAILLYHGSVGPVVDAMGANALHHAARCGKLDVLLLLLSVPNLSHADEINRMDKAFGRTPLLLAAQRGMSDLVFALVQHGASILLSDVAKQTPLMWACKRGHVTTVRLILTCLTAAANAAHLVATTVDAAPPLINATLRSWVNCLDDCGRSALSHAAEHDDGLDVIRWLLAHGASIDIGEPTKHAISSMLRQRSVGPANTFALLLNMGAETTVEGCLGQSLSSLETLASQSLVVGHVCPPSASILAPIDIVLCTGLRPPPLLPPRLESHVHVGL